MIYPSALQAITVSESDKGEAAACEPTDENIAFLLLVCTDAWVEGGARVFACTDVGCEWQVKVEGWQHHDGN